VSNLADIKGEEAAIQEFLGLVQANVSPLDAAIQVGWTPSEYRRRMSDRYFAQTVLEADQVSVARVETKVQQLAEQGVPWAAQLVLYNKAPEKWSDRKRVDVGNVTQVNVTLIETSKEALRAMLREDPVGMARALGPGSALDDTIIDAEVVDGSG
jgi:hypothetical protein